MRGMPHKFVDRPMLPEDNVRAANEMAYRFAADAPIRGLAMRIIGQTDNVFRDGPPRIARWIVENVRYGQESPGIEVLQGPYTTLPPGIEIGDFRFGGIGVGDCDDLALLFATLCRAAGIEAFFAGVAELPYNGSFVHAIGYCAANQRFYELSKDEPYGGLPNKPLEMAGVPLGQAAFCYDPVTKKWHRFTNDPNKPAHTYSVDAGGMYDAGRMAATAMSGPSGGGLRISEFDGSLPISPSQVLSPDNPQFSEALETSFMEANGWLESEFGINLNSTFGVSGSEMADAIQSGIISYAQDRAGDLGARNTQAVLSAGTAFAMNPTPVTAVVSALVVIGVVTKGLIHQARYRRRYERLNDRMKGYADEICGMCLPSNYDQTRTGLLQMCSMKTRMMEIIPIFEGEAGKKRSNFRTQVRVPLLQNQYSRDGGYSMFKRGPFTRNQRIELTEQAQAWGHGRFLDGVTTVKGMEYVGARNNRGTSTSMAACRDGYELLRDLVRNISRSAVPSGAAQRELSASLFWSLMAQILRLRFDGAACATIDQTQVGLGQHSVPITYARFWQGVDADGIALPTGSFNRLWRKSILDMVRPAERVFGAEAGTFDDGAIVDALAAAGYGNFSAFERDVGSDPSLLGREALDFDIPDRYRTDDGGGSGGSGTGIAIAAGLGVGALLLANR